MGSNPLIGPNDERFGARFPDMSEAYAADFRKLALEEGKKLPIKVSDGVYVAVHGPSYETPAELRFLRTIGADTVGMSTVPEPMVARRFGMKRLPTSFMPPTPSGIP